MIPQILGVLGKALLGRNHSVESGSARALVCGDWRPRRPQKRVGIVGQLLTVLCPPPNGEGAGRDTRGRVCSPWGWLALLLGAIHGVFAAEPSVESKDLPHIPPTEPTRALSTFRVKAGFKMELVAAEPLVVDPIALSFDERGRLFVVEMVDYSERRDEHLGQIRLLEDTDGDGRLDKATVYAKNLPWPTAVICYDGGVFVGASPDILYLKDTNGDGEADTREVVFTGFAVGVERLNVQALLNSFTWGLDNRIHGATSGNGGRVTSTKNPQRTLVELRGRDFSFDPRTLELRAESGGGQHGLSFDDAGRKFVCSNSAHLQMLMYDELDAKANALYTMPSPLVNIAEDGPAAAVYRISPDEPWRVIRTRWRVAGLVPGPIEGGGHPSGYFTAATGVTIYRGNAWPKEFRGNVIVADCGSNLIHRKQLFADGASFVGRRPVDESKTEFIASKDNWFRPVQFANAPDGTLYVADMYREIIEHPWSLPPNIKQHLDLNRGNDRGRIYRIVPDGFKQPALPKLDRASTEELVQTLAHENGWHRDTAARLLYQRQDRSAIPALEKMLDRTGTPLGRWHALHALSGLAALTERHLDARLADTHPLVREHAVRLSRNLLRSQKPFPEALWKNLVSLATDPDARVRYHLAFLLGDVDRPERIQALSALAASDCGDAWIGAAVLRSLGGAADSSFFFLPSTRPGFRAKQDSLAGRQFFSQLLGLIAARKDPKDIARIVQHLQSLPGRTEPFTLARPLLEGMRRAGLEPRGLESETQKRLKSLQQDAIDAARDPNEPEAQRLPAIQLLGAMNWADAGAALSAILAGNPEGSVQAAAISALARFRETEAGRAMVRSWPQLTPRSRSEVLSALTSRPQQISALLDGLESNMIQRAELSANQAAFLRAHADRKIRQRAAQLLPLTHCMDREKSLEQFRSSLDLVGNAQRGRKTYQERCLSCHRAGREGYAVGPDLASVRANGKEKLLVSILDPNREVAPSYLNYLVETKEGESYLGLIATENATSVTLRQAFGVENSVLRSNIRRIQSQNQSIMPEGLEASLSPQDLADLLEFIVTDEGAQ
jgi:putative membrane-bound dehydrogenase-like protein